MVVDGVTLVHKLFIAADDRAAFPTSDGLACMKPERSEVSNGPQLLATVFGKMPAPGRRLR